jgi:hypothetical protein
VSDDKMENVPAVAITFNATIGPQRTIIFQTHIERDLPVRDYNELLDKLTSAVRRQEAKGELIDEQMLLEAERFKYDLTVKQYSAIEEKNKKDWVKRGKKGDPTLSDAEVQGQLNCKTSMEAGKEAIKKKEARVLELRGIIEKVD